MSKKTITILSILALLFTLLAGCAAPRPTEIPATSTPVPAEPTETPDEAETVSDEVQTLTLATTTSTDNSGLLGYLLPFFEKEYNVEVEVIAVGTGQALQTGEDGNADVLMVHARSLEDAFMEAGHGVRREDLMYNDFVIVGPPDDPAGIEGMSDAPEAFVQIAEEEATFISRGDDSGTHTKEKAIWEEVGADPSGGWYVSAGQGMGEVLTMADEQQGYTLSDRATYLARTLESTDLEILVEGDPILFNPYGVIAVNPEKSPEINAELANQFIDWLISVPTQEKIGEFGVEEFGMPLFTPDSEPWREVHPEEETVQETDLEGKLIIFHAGSLT
ncbi:MAG: substrate-binding domain-containing protein, partial [Anaerolineales bacterium]